MNQSTEPEKVTSFLETYDITTNQRTLIQTFPYLIEAPDWTSDGKWLVYNSEGLIYKLPACGGESQLIDTGFANKCNNDHLISPNGKLLAVSHRSLPEGRPTIFILNAEGDSTPIQVTPSLPSYLHGWSPDGKSLTYCANRDKEMDVYTINIDGTNEVRLTDSAGLNDGPEYSPDGEYIWFNSMRTGLMQIWKMKTDGSEQTQITFDDDRNSWFPHISPDGKYVIYIAYKKGDLEPHEHLRYKNVEIRKIPIEGGKPEILMQLFGGQGTFNVNSWSPDSKQFAFVSFRLD